MKYTKPTTKVLQKILDICQDSKEIFITSHISPDDDSISSVLSLYYMLSRLYPQKKLQVVYSGERPKRYDIFTNAEKIQYSPDITQILPSEIDLLIVCDGEAYHRFTAHPDVLRPRIKNSICIDHHKSPTAERHTLSLINSVSSSTAEMIYRLFFMKNRPSELASLQLTTELAELFMLGILGDTGNVSFLKPNQTGTLDVIKALMKAGNIEIQEFQGRYGAISKRVFDLIAIFATNTSFHKRSDGHDFQVSYIDWDTKEAGDYSDLEVAEASGIYAGHYIRRLEGYKWGFILTPRGEGDCRISFRSLPGSINVRKIVEDMGIGGGHDRAAGGGFKKADYAGENGLVSVGESKERVLAWLEANTLEIS